MQAHLRGINSVDDYIRLIKTFCESEEFRARVILRRSAVEAKGRKCYFVHLHKTGGTTVHDWLLYEAAPGRVFPGFFISDLVRSVNVLSSVDYFSGHYSNNLDILLGQNTRKATMLRDPGERVISRYFHVMRNKQHSLHSIFSGLSIDEATCSKKYRGMIGENYQAKEIIKAVSSGGEPLTSGQLDLLSEDELYHRAKASIEEFELVGVLDHIVAFITKLAQLWDLAPPDRIGKKNANPLNVDYDAQGDLKQRIREANMVDYRLYQSILERWSGAA